MVIVKKIKVQSILISVSKIKGEDYISITDMAAIKNATAPKDVVKNWLRNRSTLEFLGIWERIYNPEFKGVEFDSFLYESGSNSFTLSPSNWIRATNAQGMVVKEVEGVVKKTKAKD